MHNQYKDLVLNDNSSQAGADDAGQGGDRVRYAHDDARVLGRNIQLIDANLIIKIHIYIIQYLSQETSSVKLVPESGPCESAEADGQRQAADGGADRRRVRCRQHENGLRQESTASENLANL